MPRNVGFVPEDKIAKALEVFWSKGYHAASLSDLTRAMKLNKSSLYNTFKDKHSLFIASLKAYGKIVAEDYASAIAGKLSPIEKIDSIIDKIVVISSERKNSCFGVRISFEIAGEDKEAQEIIRSGHDATITLFKTLIKEAQVASEVKMERDADAMANLIFNSFAGLRQSYIIYSDRKLVENMACEIKNYIRS